MARIHIQFRDETYLNEVAKTDIDFPVVRAADAA